MLRNTRFQPFCLQSRGRTGNRVGLSVLTSLYFNNITIFYSYWSIVTIECRLYVVPYTGLWKTYFPSLRPSPSLYILHDFRFYIFTPLCLNNSGLPFVPCSKFLGLLLYSKRGHWILKILLGWSWGSDRMVMLCFYCSLVRFELDYGSFMHDFPTKSKLSIITLSTPWDFILQLEPSR